MIYVLDILIHLVRMIKIRQITIEPLKELIILKFL